VACSTGETFVAKGGMELCLVLLGYLIHFVIGTEGELLSENTEF
jgi:hypothetical protein